MRAAHPLEELIVRKSHIGATGCEALLLALRTDRRLRLLALSGRDFLDEHYALPAGLVVNAPGQVLRCLPLHAALKYCFLLSIERRWPHTYLPPELVRIIFAYLACPIYRTVSVT